MNDLIAAVLAEINVCLPGVIVAYDGTTATVRPAIPKQLANGETLAAPQIVRVPVCWPIADGGKAMVTVPLKAGDPVKLTFSQRSLENWLSGSDQAPDDPRQFDLTDCFASPVMRPGPAADTENVNVMYGAGSMKISADGTFTFAGTAAIFNLPTFFNELMTYAAGMTGAAGSGSSIKIQGDVEFSGGSVTHNGKDIGETHRNSGVQPGSGTSGGVV